MHRRPHRPGTPRTGWLVCVGLLACLASAAAARAEGDPALPGIGGWSPFAEAGIALHMQRFDASGSSSIGVAGSDNKLLSVLSLRLGGGLRGPQWEALPGAPRLVVGAGIRLPTRSSSTLLSETQTFGVLPDQDQRSTEYGVQWGSFWETELGLQFLLPLDLFEVRVTPGLSYVGTRIRYEAAFSVRTPPLPTQPLPTPSRLFSIRGNASSTQHLLGPRLELEVAFVELRRVQLSIFLDGRALWLLSERSENLAFAGDIDGSPETGTVRFESEALAGSLSFGIRGAFW